jgi:hypothetical protein
MATYVIKIKKINNGKVITLCADTQPEMLRKIYIEKLPKTLEDKLISKLFMNTTSTTIDRIEDSGYFIDFIILGSIVRE